MTSVALTAARSNDPELIGEALKTGVDVGPNVVDEHGELSGRSFFFFFCYPSFEEEEVVCVCFAGFDLELESVDPRGVVKE